MSDSALPPVSPTAVGAQFQPTAWSDLLALTHAADPAQQRAALERICRAYWKPIYAFIRRSGHPPAEAQDLTQDFFQHLLRKERIKLADQRRGRFRSFILKALQNFLASDWDRRHARKRDCRTVVSLDESMEDGRLVAEARTDETPAHAFDRNWALDVVTSVRNRLQGELREAGRGQPLELLPLALLEDTDTRYAAAATQLGMTEAAVKKAVQRLRARWAELLREEIASTVQSQEDVEVEYRELLVLLQEVAPSAAILKDS